ncbi:MAG: FtsK/SpoIIIE domain-containing protein, partial [Acidimicrobiales bacterium]
VGGLPVLGLAEDSLEPLGFTPTGTLLISGPPASGRTTALATLAVALHRWREDIAIAYLGTARSPLVSLLEWTSHAVGPADVAGLASELAAKLDASLSDDEPSVVLVESIADFHKTEADTALQALAQVCFKNGHLIIVEGETSAISGSWPLFAMTRTSRYGIALQPDQTDGSVLYKTTFGRVKRSDFPVGRGFLVAGGKYQTVQLALPE